ncbi:copper resistance protein CopC [Candidatus Daviesbacteria bacterium]|nr:copper resistance protein CopC [Candidatus Daviesbacteria bacterium]
MRGKNTLIILVLALSLLSVLFYLLTKEKPVAKTTTPKSTNLGSWNPNLFDDPVNTNHFLSSDPKHGQAFKTLPKTISLTFDTPLQKGSYFKAEVWDENYIDGGERGVSFSDDHKTMTGKLEDDAITGIYVVMYTACFTNEKCQDGNFRFLVDPNTK